MPWSKKRFIWVNSELWRNLILFSIFKENTANTLCSWANRLHSWSQTPAPGFIESDLWFIVCHSPFRWKQMLFVSNSPTPGTREILSAHLITIQQAGPIKTLYFQGLFLPRPEEAGSVTLVTTVTTVKTGTIHQALVLGGLHVWNHLPKWWETRKWCRNPK